MSKAKYTANNVALHNTPDSLWIIIDQSVYEVAKFQKDYPGGKKILQKFAGKDASKQFRKFHNEADSILLKYRDKLQLGGVEVETISELTPVAEPVPEAAQAVLGIA